MREFSGFDALILRIFARLLDMILIFVPAYLFIAGSGMQLLLGWPSWGVSVFSAALLSGIVLYHPVCELLWGGSMGKLFVGLRVVNEEGNRISIQQAFIRVFTSVVGALIPLGVLVGAGAILLTKEHQRIGDVMAKTFVLPQRLLSGEPLSDWDQF